MLKIGITGTHGGGKTTLTDLLAKELHLIPINQSRPGAAARKMGYSKPSEVPLEHMGLFQWTGLIEQIAQEREAVALCHMSLLRNKPGKRGFVTDRTTLDFLAYALLQMDDEDGSYVGVALNHLKSYDIILLVPPNPSIAPEENGARHTSDPMPIHNEIERLVGVTEAMELPYYRITSDGPEARLAEVLEELKRRNLRRTSV